MKIKFLQTFYSKLPAVHSIHFPIRPDKIEAWGMCSDRCQPKEGGFNFANQNLLTDEECELLDPGVNPEANLELEFCAGPHLLLPPSSGCCFVA